MKLSEKIKMPKDNEGYHNAYILSIIAFLVLIVVFGNILISNSRKNVSRVVSHDSSYVVTRYTEESSSRNKKETSSGKDHSSKKTTDTSSSKAASGKSDSTENVSEADEAYSFPADINKADIGCLCAAEGIGEELAQRIIDLRDDIGVIYNMDLLLEIDGIGEKKLESLKRYFYVSDSQFREIAYETTVAAAEPNEYEEPEPPAEEPIVTKAPEPEEQKEMRKVNINTASADEIADCLLLDIEQAEQIVQLRDIISYFSSPKELLLNDTMSKEMILERIDYIVTD